MAANLLEMKLIIPAAAVVGMVIVGTGGTNVQASAPATPTVQVPAAHPPPAPPAAAGLTLPDGKTLDVGPGSPEAHLVYALADDSQPLPQTFRFDELTFAAGSWDLGVDADKTLDNVAAILNAYPSARVRIEGRWAKGGSPPANRALAASRARAVKEKLVARGIAPNRIDTTRGGQARAGRAEGGRRANRRAEIILLRR